MCWGQILNLFLENGKLIVGLYRNPLVYTYIYNDSGKICHRSKNGGARTVVEKCQKLYFVLQYLKPSVLEEGRQFAELWQFS